MKYNVFIEQLIYVEVEVEAEDHQDAAEKVALAACTDANFLTSHPDYCIDEIECEVTTVAEKEAANRDEMSLELYNSRVVVFDAETVNKWLGELARAYGTPVTGEGGAL
jgi:hypothetical protein